MKIIENCWDEINASECDYGAHLCLNSVAKIYVNNWLDVGSDLFDLFSRKNEEGFVGHCLLVFRGVREFDLVAHQYEQRNEGIFWGDRVVFRYEGQGSKNLKKYHLSGGLHGFSASVSIVIEAEQFALHVLDKNEPGRGS
ncbi:MULTISPECIES: hypothetical protein [Variovorax]|uniref:hypothetical protein n=1 Tax=Variovorax TaxID=34072 RepID=UPI00286236D5|nr:hypothetical protein [Variovorax sp. 3319]MDR6891035.1 hypothetical protein [Variovorax sp. 3319]